MRWGPKIGNAKANLEHCIMWSNEVSCERGGEREKMGAKSGRRNVKHGTKSHIWLNGRNKCWCAVKSSAIDVAVVVVVVLFFMHFCIDWSCVAFIAMCVSYWPYPKWPVVQSVKHFSTGMQCVEWWKASTAIHIVDEDKRQRAAWHTAITSSHHHSSYRCAHSNVIGNGFITLCVCSNCVTCSRRCAFAIYFFCVNRQQCECSSNYIDMLNKFVNALPFSWTTLGTLKLSNHYATIYNLMDLCLMSQNNE